MAWQFKIHYTLEQARALLPQVRGWLEELNRLRQRLVEYDQSLAKRMESGEDLGGDVVNRSLKSMAGLKRLLHEFQTREIQVKDVDRGLIDFPAIIGGKEVFLCWEQGEDDIEFWHDLESGYAGRERL